jgi:predicted TIM-barrel fold metal-dependent hydrolase
MMDDFGVDAYLSDVYDSRRVGGASNLCASRAVQVKADRVGAIDIVCNLYTASEVALRGQHVDTTFLNQVRVEPTVQVGVSVEQLLGRMDEARVDIALIPATKAGSWRMRDSWSLPYERVAEVCSAHPERFRGLAGVDPTLGMRGLRELEHAVRDLRFVGAHLYPHWFELSPDHALYYPIYSKCCELDIPIMVQVGQCLRYGSTHTFPSVGRPITLDRVACDFPELRLIGMHIGYPWTEEMISMAYKHPNVYIGSDAYAPKYWPDSFRHFLNSWGSEKVLFGTDFPVIDIVRARSEIDAMQLRPESSARLLRANALRVFNLGIAEE